MAGAPGALATGRHGDPGAGRGRLDRGSVDGAQSFLHAMTDAYPEANPGPRMPQSYADELGLFSTAFVYDVALAVCAALTDGRRGLGLATTIGDGLLVALDHDPQHDHGRLRQAYNVGPYVFYDGTPQPYGLVRPDGTANVGSQFGFLGTAVGDMAWPGIALVQLYRRTREHRFLDAAVRIGSWITGHAVSPGSRGGFRFGVDAANVPIPIPARHARCGVGGR